MNDSALEGYMFFKTFRPGFLSSSAIRDSTLGM